MDYQAIACFFHYAEPGALIIIDEAQRTYPKRLRNLTSFDNPQAQGEQPKTVEQAFDMHRHFNWDIYLCTTNIGKIHQEIRQVCELAYRHTNLSNLLPFSKNKWKEQAHDAESSGKSPASYTGTYKVYKADKRLFQCYQSTATGKTKDSNENRSILRDPKLKFIFIAWLIALCFGLYSVKKINASDTEELAHRQTPESDRQASALGNSDAARLDVSSLRGATVRDVVAIKPLSKEYIIKGHAGHKDSGGIVLIMDSRGVYHQRSMSACEVVGRSYECIIEGRRVTYFSRVGEAYQ